MKRKHKFSMVLVAAALIVALLAGAGIAASQLGVFHILDAADPIVPLEGAQDLVGTNLGSVENDLVKLTVEEAVFDGQGALVQMRISPKDGEKYVMYDSMMQNATEDLFESESLPVELPESGQILETDEGTMEIINKDGSVQLLLNGAPIEVPSDRESALAQGLPIYTQGGKTYYADFEEVQVTGCKDGREIMRYWPIISMGSDAADAEAQGLENFFDTMNAEGQEDGSVIVWASGYAEAPLNADALEISCGAKIYLDDETIDLDGLKLTLPKNEEERKVAIVPVGDGKGERFQILSGTMTFTKVRGYFSLDYKYDQAETGEEMGITFRMYDANGKRITLGGGSCTPEGDVYHDVGEMQSFAEIPETIYLEAKVIGESVTLGRVECKLTEE